MSDSPSFYKAVRLLALKWTGIAVVIGAVLQYNILPIKPEMNAEILNVVKVIGIILGSVVGSSFLGTTDPALMSPESKAAAIVNSPEPQGPPAS